jgi:hypothetical protein
LFEFFLKSKSIKSFISIIYVSNQKKRLTGIMKYILIKFWGIIKIMNATFF